MPKSFALEYQQEMKLRAECKLAKDFYRILKKTRRLKEFPKHETPLKNQRRT